MRIAAGWVLGLVFVIIANAAEPPVPPVPPKPRKPPTPSERSQWRIMEMKLTALEDRAMALQPRRRDEPMRYENITDDEVREIQLVAEKALPRVLVNISPVVTGCPCEEGPQCTDQVYLVANTADRSRGLQLSRVKNAWRIGVVQEWWLRYEALRARENKMNYRAFREAEHKLLFEFPACVGELEPAVKPAVVKTSK